MSTNATSFPLPRPWIGARRGGARVHVGVWRARLAVGALLMMIVVSLLVVIVAADRPTFLVPPSAQHYFPTWLAGPLGGLWPQFSRSTQVLDYLFTYGLLAMYAAYVLVLWVVGTVRARWVIGAVLALHLVLFLAPPLALTDIFNYLNYGRMEIVHGLNPYASVPFLEPHDDPAFAMSNWHHLISPYGPMFTILTFALVPLGVAASFWVVKGILMVSSLATLVLVWRCARLLGRDPVRAVAFVGLNPVVLLWGLGGDHNDFITVFFIMFAFYLLLRARAAALAAALPAGEETHAERPTTPRVAGGLPLVAIPSEAVALEVAPGLPAVSARGPGTLARPAATVAAPAVRAAAGTGRPGPVASAADVAPAMASSVLGFAADPSVAAAIPRGPRGWVNRAMGGASVGVGTLRLRRNGAPTAAPTTVAAPPLTAGRDTAVLPDPDPDPPELSTSNGAHAQTEFAVAAGHGAPDGADATRRTVGSALRSLFSAELCAGVALIVAVTMKASAAVLIPVVLLSLAWSRRRVIHFTLGAIAAAIAAGTVTYVAFGAHIPDLSTQGKLITAESLPNLLGLLLGQGGETATLQRIVQGVLVVCIVWASWWAWRRREFLTPAAWATVALLATLSWVLPWYVLWLLPLAALAGSRALQRVALVFGVYLILVWAPLAGSWYAAIHFAPTKTALGQAHQRETKFLLH